MLAVNVHTDECNDPEGVQRETSGGTGDVLFLVLGVDCMGVFYKFTVIYR